MADAIRLENLTVQRDGVRVLENVSAVVPHRSVTAIIGPNGAGKTSLLYAILGLTSYTGRVVFTPADARRRLGYVPQTLDFDRQSPCTV
ncbi:MAG: ATP-binding cassette domain-containing protein, partial [Planctomycetia bacterium]